MSAKMSVPELRFGEFRGEWEEKKLGEISNNIMYGVGSSATKYDGINKYLRITDIDESSRTFLPNPLSSPDGIIEDKYKLIDGDIVFARTGASVGKSYLYNNKDGNLIFAGFLIKVHITDANPYFVYANTFKEYYNKWVQIMSVRSGQPGINAEEYKLLPINLPSKPEQEKIASFLSSVDSKIEQLSKKKRLLEQYKKGVMQKIFSQELRFKEDDGSEFPEWVEKKLKEIGKFNAGGDLSKLDYSKEKSEKYLYPIYANGSGEGLYGYATTFQYKENCVTVSGRGSLGYANVRNEKFNAIVRLIIIDPQENINSKFLEETINKINFVIESTGVPQLTVPQISSYKVNIPSLKEQTKIANCLSSLDKKIELTDKELNAIKKFKKALFQKMFV